MRPRMPVAHGVRLVARLAAAMALLGPGTGAPAQEVDIEDPPGVPESRGRLGPAIGAAGTSRFDLISPDFPIGGRPGPSTSRAPIGGLELEPPELPGIAAPVLPPIMEPAEVPRYGDLEIPVEPEELGPEDGLTLDQAIERLVRANLDLLALRFEIPQAEADVLTASLRTNPVLFADAQMIPYGIFHPLRPGGPPQYDINITFPVDVTGKRRARTLVAQRAKQVTEAQLQDVVRLQIDNLYTAFVDVLAARETYRFSQAYVEGISRVLELNLLLLEQEQVTRATVDAIRAQLEQAELQVREAGEALGRAVRTLAHLLNVPRPEADHLELRAALRDVRELPYPPETLVQMALNSRPDLMAFRLGLQRAIADVDLARANRYSDIFLLYQPYTFEDNRPFGLKSAHSWAVGVTAALPIFNRNQGNLARAQANVRQTEIEMTSLQRLVVFEVEEAIREFELSRIGVLEMEREIIPASRRVRDTAFLLFQGGEASALEYFEAQREYNEVVGQYRDMLVRHRRGRLALNTAVSVRVVP